MLVNNTEALKSWLIVVLEPLCDADSSALARYVLALLKKDKPEKELKRVMIEQLDVFLGGETKPFVEKLFNSINSEEYLVPVNNVPRKPDDVVIAASVDVNFKTEVIQEPTSTEYKVSETPSSSAYLDKNPSPPIVESKAKDIQNNQKVVEPVERVAYYPIKSEPTSTEPVQANSSSNNHVRSASPPVRTNADKENQPRATRRRRASLRSRSRSRSRSNDKLSRRSRSRDRRMNEREKNQRQFRNKSPPAMDARHVTSYDRRRGNDRRRIGGPNAGGADERSPRFGNNSGEGSRKSRPNRSNSRSRSPSGERAARNKGSPASTRVVRPSPDRAHHLHGPHENEKRQRCRDFDEKGYCVRGETCPWDHGVNPVVFEGINNTALISMSLREYNPDAPEIWSRTAPSSSSMIGGAAGLPGPNSGLTSGSGINPFSGNTRPGNVMVGVGGPGSVAFPHLGSGVDKVANGVGTLPADYARNTVAGPGFRGVAPMIPFPFNPAAAPLQRELIPIPVDAGAGTGGDVSALQQGKRRFELEDSVAIADCPTKRKVPLNSRLGPRLPNIQSNCSLELRKVPRGLNTIAHLNNHFAKFGKIVNIQITYDGDPEAAIVTFSTHAEANVAYRSTEAVLNNRFIKVFWHSQDSGNSGGTDALQISGGRKNSQYHLNNIPAVPAPNSDSAKTLNTNVSSQNTPAVGSTTNTTTVAGTETSTTTSSPLAATHVPPTSLRLKNNVPRPVASGASNAIIRKKQVEQAKAVVQLANGLRKRKQELLQSYVKQMKSALELVERCEPNDPQRTKTLETIKVLQETIDKLRKEIAAEQEQMQVQMQTQKQPPISLKKTKEQQKKELLDIELELFAQQQEGNDTTAIQKRLEELQRSLGIAPGSTPALAGGHTVASNKVPHFASSRLSPRARATFPEVSTRVDRRPKTIVVTGFTKDEADFVLGHFKHFGEVTKHDVDKEIPQLILSYATRINAEQAVLRGKLFKDKRLQISWAPVVQLSGTNKTTQQTGNFDDDVTKKLVSELEGAVPDTLPELRLEDEEEDEESEDRSWRR